MKTKTVCGRCQLTTYSFTSFDFITFNIDLVQKFLMKNNFQNLMNKIDLNLCFSCQNNTLIQSMSFLKYCRQCLQNQIHSERKQFYTFPRYLIICLDRGADCENKTKIFYNTMLNLTSNYDNPNSFSFFMLKGIVKRFDTALRDFVNKESTTALVDMTNIFPELYQNEGGLPDVFITEGLATALDCISEYMMHLGKLYNLDYYK